MPLGKLSKPQIAKGFEVSLIAYVLIDTPTHTHTHTHTHS